jgi:hypothetical protein
MKPAKKLYQFHVANLQEIDRAMDKTARSLSLAISQSDEITASAFMRLYALLLGAWAECRLRKLIYEPQGFDDGERNTIQIESTQLNQWQKAVVVAFRRQYKIPKAVLSIDVLPHSAYSRYTTLSELLTNDLGSVIELRNKLAHGQWVYPLNSDGDDVAQEQMDALRVENLLSLRFKKTLLESLSSAIHDLVVSRPTFERDFDDHLRIIVETQRNLKNRDYQSWVKIMRQKYERGKVKKAHLSTT